MKDRKFLLQFWEYSERLEDTIGLECDLFYSPKLPTREELRELCRQQKADAVTVREVIDRPRSDFTDSEKVLDLWKESD